MNKNIVILGGSFAGVSTAHYLLKHAVPRLPEPSSYQVVLVSPASQAMWRPAAPRALISDDTLDQKKLFVDIPSLFDQYPEHSFRFIHAAAKTLDHANRTVTVTAVAADGQSQTLDYHALVIATGATTTSPLFDAEDKDTSALRAEWAAVRRVIPSATNVVIAGAGPTGVETAGELAELLNGKPGWFSWAYRNNNNNNNKKANVTIVTAGSQILSAQDATVAAKAEAMLERLGVTVIKKARVKAVEPADAGRAASAHGPAKVQLDDGQTLHADLYIPTMGTRANTDFADASLLADDGRVDINAETLRVDTAGERVYAIGDVAGHIKWPAITTIYAAVPVVCANIKRDLLLAAGAKEASVGADRKFKEDKNLTQVVPIGSAAGVGVAMGFTLPSIVVQMVKGRDYMMGQSTNMWNGKKWDRET